MKKGFMKVAGVAVSLVMAISLSACGGGGEAKVESDLSMAGDVQNYIDNIDLEYAYDLTETLAYDEQYWDNELGWRTAGSDAEHKTADFLAEEMEKIGLTDVTKVGTKVDKFQFNDSKFTIKGTDIDLMPASYHCNGTDKDGITAEIVDVGTGFAEDYDGKDVKGKIVLAGVDQWNEAWIDNYIRQANARGAVALVTYSVGGYGELNDDTINVQDTCCESLMPVVAISANQAKDVIAAIEEGNNEATLMVDAVVEEGTGTTYNVMGTIKGKSSDQQILIGGHYDKYWYGFQDDSAAIGLDLAVAKALIESGYTPENDIVVVAHGAEEWGATDSQFDYTTGAWGMIHDAHPEWADKTIALLNCELPAFEVTDNEINIAGVPEFRTLITKMVKESGLVVAEGDVKMLDTPGPVSIMEDGVSYRYHGVPYVINGFEDETFMQQRYHTTEDSKDTWDEDTMKTNLNWYGAFAIYLDKMPALELDLTAACDDLTENLDQDVAKEAGVDVDKYLESIEALRTAAEEHNKKIADVNERYEAAVKDEASEEELAELREEGAALNKQSREAFEILQAKCTHTDDVDVYVGHPNLDANINILQGTIEGLENKELYAEDEESGALDVVWELNGEKEYIYYLFDKQVAEEVLAQYDPDKSKDAKEYWALNRMIPVCYVGDTTTKLLAQADKDNSKVDFDAAIKAYSAERSEMLPYVKKYCKAEMNAMGKMADALK